MDRNTLLDLIPAYALGALDPDERAEVEAFLAADADARKLLADYQGLTNDLILTTPARPAPTHLTADLRERLAASRPSSLEPPPSLRTVETRAASDVKRRRAAPAWMPYALGAAAAFILVAVGLILLRPKPDPGEQLYNQIVAQADFNRIPVPEDFQPVKGELVFNTDGTQAVLRVWDLPQLSQQQTFQLWLVDDDGARSGGLLQFSQPQAPNYIVLPLEKPADQYTAFGVSIEPEGGSPIPDGPSGPRVLGITV